MERPECPKHPDGRVRKQGRYGKNKQYQRWQCVPPDGGKPHLFQPTFARKQVGGEDGCCPECEREWRDGEGMRTATGDRYTLRDKAATLMKLADGYSYRDASHFVRIRAGQTSNGGSSYSRDGRLAGDWTSQYARIVASPDLPTRWPSSALVLDHLTFSRLDTDDEGEPKQGGQPAFYVLGALGYEDDDGIEDGKRPRTPKVWALAASEGVDASSWSKFLDRLYGRPSFVVCDQHRGLMKALRQEWPEVPVYPCVQHLYDRASTHVRRFGLSDSRLGKRLSRQSFYQEDPYDALCYLLDRYLQEDRDKLKTRQLKGVAKIDRLVERAEDGIKRRLNEPRYPLSTGALERELRHIKGHLYDRRNGLRNMERLDDLLALMAARRRVPASEGTWSERLRQHHDVRKGKPPPRRFIDNPDYAPR